MKSHDREPLHARTSRTLRTGLIGLACVALFACSSPPTPSLGSGPEVFHQSGLASWYSDALHGRTTASGETYDRNAFTAAHRELPFGTRVRVTRARDGRSVVVRINDRGPFVAGRVIDLSRRAAEELDMIEDGVVDVRLVIVD